MAEKKQTQETKQTVSAKNKTTSKVPAKATANSTAVKTAAKKKPAAKKTADSKTQAKPRRQAAPKVGATKVKPKNKILYVATEAMPFIATGGLGEVIGSLPKALKKKNPEDFDVRVMLPFFGDIKDEYREKMDFVGNITVWLSWRAQYCGVFKLEQDGVIYYFIDNEYYFKRQGLYGFFDDGERFAFFSRAALECMGLIDFYPNIIHAHDWQTALVPIYYHTKYFYRPGYGGMKTVFTIHNIEYQGKYDFGILGDIFDLGYENIGLVEYKGCINLMKGAIECSNMVSTVSPTYAQEIHNSYFAHGLEQILERNSYKLTGILNGIDTDAYNPQTDPALFEHYSKDTLDNKVKNKLALQELCGLPIDANVPLIGIVTRLVSHKGLDLITRVLEEILSGKVQVVVLGVGERQYEDYFRSLSDQYKPKVAALLTYNADLSRKIYAAADLFLMPSKSEPCGLAQMIACRYGTVPIVRATGGLRDSIHDVSGENGNGFVFQNYNAHEMLDTIRRALALYEDPQAFAALSKYIMDVDFSWNKSALEYAKMYETMLD